LAIKKSDLYSSLWKSCDALRGGMDASQYKDYVLVLLFVKYVSDKFMGQRDSLLQIPKGGSFADMVALKGDKHIGEKMNIIIANLAKANDLVGVIDVADFNDSDKLGKEKEKVDRLSNLIGIFNTPALDFKGNRAEGDDILGDAYEYLMRNFATESGKSKGQFYTPAEVSRVMAKVIGMGGATSAKQTIFDPTCGSGSLLIKAHDEAKGSTGPVSQDDQILVPYTTVQDEFVPGNNVRTIGISVASADQIDTVKTEITTLLESRHNIAIGGTDDFTIADQAQLLTTVGGVSDLLTLLLAGIASISLLVGGIGIMNIMLVSVRERTREIGIRKAIGARGRDILAQFLVEALVLSVLGGVFGIILGVAVSYLIGTLAGWGFVFSPVTPLVAVLFSLLVGVVFGVWPARQAARLDPIVALRYE